MEKINPFNGFILLKKKLAMIAIVAVIDPEI